MMRRHPGSTLTDTSFPSTPPFRPARGHAVALERPRQVPGQVPEADETLVRGANLPRYPGLKFGLPATRQLRQLWRDERPDAIYVATEGPLGWSALRAARRLGIPAASGFHTRFDRYMRDYGAAFLQPVALRWMRHFHNLADATLVPTRELRDFLGQGGFENVKLLPRAVDTRQFHPAFRNEPLRQAWGAHGDAPVEIHVGRIAAERSEKHT